MADKNKLKAKRLERRKFHIRKTLAGSAERPRLSVFRSDKHISAQVIDDLAGKTLVSHDPFVLVDPASPDAPPLPPAPQS